MNDLPFLITTIELLENQGINTILFGGWAEEMTGVIKPRAHKDIDLLYISNDFSKVDSFIKKNKGVKEIEEKRFPHKRAFFLNGIMVELILIEQKQEIYITNFWNLYSFTWPLILSHRIYINEKFSINVADPDIIEFYRSQQTTISVVRNKAEEKKDIAA